MEWTNMCPFPFKRNERITREGEASSPARITIAQAALLNLHGQDHLNHNQQIQQSQQPHASHLFGLSPMPAPRQLALPHACPPLLTHSDPDPYSTAPLMGTSHQPYFRDSATESDPN